MVNATMNGGYARLQSWGGKVNVNTESGKESRGVKVNVKWKKTNPALQATLQFYLSALLLQFHKSDRLHKGL